MLNIYLQNEPKTNTVAAPVERRGSYCSWIKLYKSVGTSFWEESDVGHYSEDSLCLEAFFVLILQFFS